MKITKEFLKRIIKEELEKTLNENNENQNSLLDYIEEAMTALLETLNGQSLSQDEIQSIETILDKSLIDACKKLLQITKHEEAKKLLDFLLKLKSRLGSLEDPSILKTMQDKCVEAWEGFSSRFYDYSSQF